MFPVRRDRGNNIVLLQSDYWDSAPRMQRKVPYSELYAELIEAEAYDMVRFLDGALVQLRYEFAADTDILRRSRVAFLPSPDLIPYQEQLDLYLMDEIYGDVVDRRVVARPLRFDFDSRQQVAKDLHHPVSHLTIGQYPYCRLAATGAITPYYFVELILRAFYRTDDFIHVGELPGPRALMPKTISPR